MYRWNMNNINNMYLYYHKRMIEEKNPVLKRKYQEVIDSLFEIIDFYEINLNKKRKAVIIDECEDFSYRDVINDDFRTLHDYGIYAPIIRDFNEQFKSIFIKQPSELSKIKISENNIVTLSTLFYQQLNEPFRDTYAHLAEHFKSRLAFRLLPKDLECAGNAHIVRHTKVVYIDVGIENTFQDYISLVHEASHAITELLNPDIIWDFNKYCFTEVDSLFFEIVGGDFIGDKTNNKKDDLIVKQRIFYDYLECASIICAKMDLYSCLSKKELRNNKLIKQYYKEEFGLKKQKIEEISLTYIHEIWHYIISYLTAIELYYIYLNDKDEALSLLYKIILLKGLKTQEYLDKIKELGIEPGKNITNYYNLIFKNMGERNGKKL